MQEYVIEAVQLKTCSGGTSPVIDLLQTAAIHILKPRFCSISNGVKHCYTCFK